MNSDILRKIREAYRVALEAKTGWGKNDVLQLYDKIVSEVLAKELD